MEPESNEESEVSKIEKIIEQWVRDHIFGSVVARETVVYNHLREKLEVLKNMLSKKE